MTPFYHPLRNSLNRIRYVREIVAWESSGKPVPPPHLAKQQTLHTYAMNYKLKLLVETGTYRGDMVEALKQDFARIISIELDEKLFLEAKQRFKRDDHIELIHGDSGIQLKDLMDQITGPTLFWLDGHFSAGETTRGEMESPIIQELQHILSAPYRCHVIIIDDAREFGSNPAYPSIEELKQIVRSLRSDLKIEIQDDMIRITPPQ